MRNLELVVLLLSTISTFAEFKWISVAASIAKTGCQDKCGNVTIFYPFGIGEGCYLDTPFEITCNDSIGAATLSVLLSEVHEISEDHFIRLSANPIRFYYNQSSGESLDNFPAGEDSLGDSFSFSNTRNKFVAIGCDIYSYIVDSRTEEFISGCATLCNSSKISPASLSTCSGIGCCQATIPRGLTDTKVWMHTMNTVTKSWAADQCSFALLVDKSFSELNKFNISDCDRSYEFPIVIDNLDRERNEFGSKERSFQPKLPRTRPH